MLVAETLEMWQRKAVLENPGLDFTPPVEALIILLNHLANEMLLRAVILKGVTTSWLKRLSALICWCFLAATQLFVCHDIISNSLACKFCRLLACTGENA